MSAATRPSAPLAPGLSPGWSLIAIALASRNATLATAA
jgi:hypothetical protein